MTSGHKLMYCKVKSCVYNNRSIIKVLMLLSTVKKYCLFVWIRRKYAQIKRHLQAKTVNNSPKQIYHWILMWEDNRCLKLKCLNDGLFLTNTQLFSFSFYKTFIDGLESCGLLVINLMFLSAVCSFILTAPIHCRGSTVLYYIVLYSLFNIHIHYYIVLYSRSGSVSKIR